MEVSVLRISRVNLERVFLLYNTSYELEKPLSGSAAIATFE